MIKKFLLDIIVDPATKQLLTYHPNEQIFKNSTHTHFKIIDDVPIFLVEDDKQILDTSVVHLTSQVAFNYKEHYKNDANFFNYFADEPKVTTIERNRNREAIIDQIPKNAQIILDIGCGNGWLAKKMLSNSVSVISTDISLKNPLRALIDNDHKNHAALVADVFMLPIAKNSVDVIVASEVMEHVVDPKKFIEKLLYCLKSEGKLILVTPYNEKIIYNMCVHCNHPTPANAHLHSFTEQSILNLLPSQSFKDISFKKLNNKYFNKLRIYKWLQFLPFHIWKLLDSVVNKIIKKPSIFIIQITK